MDRKAKGRLIIIGGHEDKTGDEVILKEVCRDTSKKDGSLVVVTVATSQPEAVAKEYTRVFKDLGASNVVVLDVRDRNDALDEKKAKILESAAAVFFTGGDQMRITSQLGDSLIFQNMQKLLHKGCTIAGTSAGAAAMPQTMIISGESDSTNEVSALSMAPGLGFIDGVVIDSHFAERGRISRLLGAVAQNPKNLGIGIDEDTAVIIESDSTFSVLGSGAVYVVDGTEISFSSLSDKNAEGVISIYNVKLHVLSQGDSFDLDRKYPVYGKVPEEKQAEKPE